jgi:LuxR family transcriptional regulator of spore coat protein
MDNPRPLDLERENDSDGEKLSLLTRRERQVYQLLLRGQTNKEISNALGITERTARFHVSNILHKFGVANRIEILAKDWPESQ